MPLATRQIAVLAALASTAFACTSAEADTALAAEVAGYWPDAWNPA